MSICKERLEAIIGNFLEIIEKEEINSTADLEKYFGEKLSIENSDEYIEIQQTPSNFGTQAHAASYNCPGKGIPLDIKINKTIGYSVITLKSEDVIPSFLPFTTDSFGNIAQEKNFRHTDFSKIKDELKEMLQKGI